MLIMLSGCDKPTPTPQPNVATSDSRVKNVHDASYTGSPKANVSVEPPFDIAAQVGAPFDKLRFEHDLGKPLSAPLSTLGGDPNFQIVSYRADARGPIRVVTVSAKNHTVAAIELTLDGGEPGAAKLREDMLKGYVHRKSHMVPMLSPNLEETVQSFDELDRPSTRARALIQSQGQVARIIFFDESMVATERILPSTKHLPSGLLEKARSIVERQKLILETLLSKTNRNGVNGCWNSGLWIAKGSRR
jgi:hypothetical protein